MLLMSIWAILCFNKNGDSIHGIRAFQNPDHPTVLWKKRRSQFPYSLYCTDGLFRMGCHTPIWGWLVVFLCECVPQRDVSALCCSCPHCIEQTMHCCTSWCRCTLSWTTRCCCPMESSPFFYILFAILSAQELKKLRWQSYFLKRTGQKKTQRR